MVRLNCEKLSVKCEQQHIEHATHKFAAKLMKILKTISGLYKKEESLNSFPCSAFELIN